LTKEIFLQETSEINQTNLSIKDSEKVLYIDFKDIYKPMLDKILYDEICDFLNITNVYKEANEIHQLWYNLHIKAEEKVKNFLQTMKPMEFPWLEAPRPVNGFNSFTKEQWESMIHLLKELYGETNA